MENFKADVRRFFYRRQIDWLLLALYLYLLTAIMMSASSIDLTGLFGDRLLPDQKRFRAIWMRNPDLNYVPSLFVGLAALHPLALLAAHVWFRRKFTWTYPTKTRWEYFRLAAGAAFLGALMPPMLLLVFDIDVDRMRRRGSGLLEFAAFSDLTLALTFAIMFWISTFFLAGAHYFFKLGREA